MSILDRLFGRFHSGGVANGPGLRVNEVPAILTRENLPSRSTMDTVARELGAPDAATFLRIATMSMKCAFKLTCNKHDEMLRLRDRVAELENDR